MDVDPIDEFNDHDVQNRAGGRPSRLTAPSSDPTPEGEEVDDGDGEGQHTGQAGPSRESGGGGGPPRGWDEDEESKEAGDTVGFLSSPAAHPVAPPPQAPGPRKTRARGVPWRGGPGP
eukprot:8466656-Pyramimonas_sp.AAC.2